MPATYHPCLLGKQTPSAIEQPDDAYLRVSGPLGPEQLVLHHGVPIPCVLTGKSLTLVHRPGEYWSYHWDALDMSPKIVSFLGALSVVGLWMI